MAGCCGPKCSKAFVIFFNLLFWVSFFRIMYDKITFKKFHAINPFNTINGYNVSIKRVFYAELLSVVFVVYFSK